ncbi:hypothetical protein CROQUDRAFT_542160 [Cronartium quercuum f. sp. fusiforme G11]|uniref:Uncharacterized protein n=1 Tax=Cronartium quercuum f. sp. fusiforme G11 TaxID=708437 RepID=A0A9P6NWE3_9BASI|nr:hypothetical protein CROQUDRAFT_542160 [Cronartium quercuum f. sp. fusiforme G11]
MKFSLKFPTDLIEIEPFRSIEGQFLCNFGLRFCPPSTLSNSVTPSDTHRPHHHLNFKMTKTQNSSTHYENRDSNEIEEIRTLIISNSSNPPADLIQPHHSTSWLTTSSRFNQKSQTQTQFIKNAIINIVFISSWYLILITTPFTLRMTKPIEDSLIFRFQSRYLFATLISLYSLAIPFGQIYAS